MAHTTSSPSLASRLPMTGEPPALALAKAVALPMPVPPPVTMPTLLAKDAMSPPEQHGHDDQVPSILHKQPSARDPRRRIRGIPSRLLCRLSPEHQVNGRLDVEPPAVGCLRSNDGQ